MHTLIHYLSVIKSIHEKKALNIRQMEREWERGELTAAAGQDTLYSTGREGRCRKPLAKQAQTAIYIYISPIQ